jgi:hypothetical protein
MGGGRFIAGVCAAFAVVLIAVPGALAATPREIYRDYADNGKLDKQYTKADLQRAAKDALIQGYGGPSQSGLESEINRSAGVDAAHQVGALPFTGVDLALIAFGGGLLLLLGAGLRRAAKNRA